MKKILLVLLLCSAFQANAVPVISLNVNQSNIQVGQSFMVDVLASNVSVLDPLLSFGFNINSSAGWNLNSAFVGPIFSDVSALLPSTDVAGLGGFILPSGNNILLASLQFTAVLAGTFSFGISSTLLDPNQGLFTLFNIFDLTLSQNIIISGITPPPPPPPTQLPEPSSIALFVLGLLGIFRFTRRHPGGLPS